MKKALLIVDLSNIYYCVKNTLGGALDYEKILRKLPERFGDLTLHRKIAHGSELEDEAKRFKKFLRILGFETKYRTPKVDSQGHILKSDCDLAIAMDIVRILDTVDVVILATADGDFVPCVQYIQSRGRLCYIFGSGISNDLKEAADDYFEITKDMLNENDKTAESLDVRPGSSSHAAGRSS